MRTQQEINDLAMEARAQIIWGKHPKKIRKWLSEQSVSNSDIDRIVSDAIRERSLEFRKRGLVNTILGLVIIICMGAVFVGLSMAGFSATFRSRRIYIIPMFIGIYGLIKTCKGLYWIIAGSKSEGSLSEI